jgi:hypothetical protein
MVGENQSFPRDGVETRSSDLAAKGTDIGVSEVIDQDHQDIGLTSVIVVAATTAIVVIGAPDLRANNVGRLRRLRLRGAPSHEKNHER